MKFAAWLTFSLLLSLTACVTINIYFPAAAAEKAADKIIDKVLASERAPASATPPAGSPSATPKK